MGLDQKELDKIVKWFNKSSLTSATIEYDIEGSYKITMSRETNPVQATQVIAAPTAVAPAYQEVGGGNMLAEDAPSTDERIEQLDTVTAPIVGTFYRSPGPDSPPFIQEGQKINKGDTLCIIEAMKVMNEFEAEYDMEIVSILVDNGALVEFGQTLFEVRPV